MYNCNVATANADSHMQFMCGGCSSSSSSLLLSQLYMLAMSVSFQIYAINSAYLFQFDLQHRLIITNELLLNSLTNWFVRSQMQQTHWWWCSHFIDISCVRIKSHGIAKNKKFFSLWSTHVCIVAFPCKTREHTYTYLHVRYKNTLTCMHTHSNAATSLLSLLYALCIVYNKHNINHHQQQQQQ